MVPNELTVQSYVRRECLVVCPVGTLTVRSYGQLRDALLKRAMAAPAAVIVDLGALQVESELNLTVFSSVWMRVNDWPGVPILLVVPSGSLGASIESSRLHWYVPTFDDVASAAAAAGKPPQHLRAESTLPPDPPSARLARRRCIRTCQRWQLEALAEDAALATTELVENSIRHAGTELRVRFELRAPGRLTVAVQDGGNQPAILHEAPAGSRCGYGMRLIANVAKTWGCAPDLYGGKIVWATLQA